MNAREREALDRIAELAHEGHAAEGGPEFPARLCRREVCQILRLQRGDFDGTGGT